MLRRTKPLNKTRRKCPTRKIRFDSEYDADRSLAHHEEPGKAVRPVRSYLCRLCNGWHLTKQAYEEGS